MLFSIHNIDTKSLLTRVKSQQSFSTVVNKKSTKNIQLNQRLQQASTKRQHSNGQKSTVNISLYVIGNVVVDSENVKWI